MNNTIYNDDFHIDRDKITRHSANVILTILVDILQINSYVDVGGGIGVFVDEYNKITGYKNIAHLVDGDYISNDLLIIDSKNFLPMDLSKRINIRRKYDLASCLEVAEHLEKERANTFVEDLVKLSDCVLFSAATVGQGGIGHINEEYMSYWISLFSKNEYTAFDIIRPLIQDDEQIPWWYKQNIMLYINNDRKDLIEKVASIKTKPLIHMKWDKHERYITSTELISTLLRRVLNKFCFIKKK